MNQQEFLTGKRIEYQVVDEKGNILGRFRNKNTWKV